VKLLADLTPLRESLAFRRLWAGTTLSSVGGAMTMFAVTLQVYDLTRSSAAVGLLGLVALVPLLAVGLPGGALIDAVDTRRLVLGCTVALMAVSAALTAQAWPGAGQVWVLYALMAVESAIGAVNEPARRSLVPALLPPGQLAAGLALQRITFQLMSIGGPVLAGVVAAEPQLGLRDCYLIDTVSFAAALYGVGRLPSDNSKKRGARDAAEPSAKKRTEKRTEKAQESKADWKERAGVSSVLAGFSFIGRTPVLAGAFGADVAATFFGLPLSLFPAINAERFGADPRTLGLFTAAIGVGGLVTAVLSGPLRHLARQGAAMLASVAVWGAAFAVFALAHSLWLTLLALGVAGAADTITVVLRGTIASTVTPAEFRGRVLSADYVVGAGGGQLGSLEAGAVGSLTTPVISALSGGLATIAAAIVIAAAVPAFRRYRAAVPGKPRADSLPAAVPAQNRLQPGQGPIIGPTVNRRFSSPNWYMTLATRWIRVSSILVG
jgi:MFS family permease